MASKNVTDLAEAATASKNRANNFTASDAEEIFRNVSEARVICYVLSLANDGMIDGSLQFDDPSATRWEPSIQVASGRLHRVRDILIERASAPDCDWWTSLSLLEALGASMWHCTGSGDKVNLDHDDLASFLRVVIESLDKLLQECEAANAMFSTAVRMDH